MKLNNTIEQSMRMLRQQVIIEQFIHTQLLDEVATPNEISLHTHQLADSGFEDHVIAAAINWRVEDVRRALAERSQ